AESTAQPRSALFRNARTRFLKSPTGCRSPLSHRASVAWSTPNCPANTFCDSPGTFAANHWRAETFLALHVRWGHNQGEGANLTAVELWPHEPERRWKLPDP